MDTLGGLKSGSNYTYITTVQLQKVIHFKKQENRTWNNHKTKGGILKSELMFEWQYRQTVRMAFWMEKNTVNYEIDKLEDPNISWFIHMRL